MTPHTLSEKWIKAAVLGTLWASSEIVLGSFLHNLRVPFSGNILTAIALVILISASYIWKEKGLFWRAAIICALMKTLSPSAVIFGPMVAIIAEGFLLEFTVRLLGRTIPAYLLGSVLSMSWILFQKIANLIIIYGNNLVLVYEDLMRYARGQFSWQFNAVWMPLVVLLAIYAVMGIVAAAIGIHTGRRLANPGYTPSFAFTSNNFRYPWRKSGDPVYSVTWLIIDVVLAAGCLLLSAYLPFFAWALLVAAVATVWATRYRRALRQLLRPRFWIFFVFITMVTALVFSQVSEPRATIREGVQAGVAMNLRAIILIMGFTVLGTELYNPRIRGFLMKGRFRQLSLALELSFETLPSVIGGIPDVRTLLRNPGGVIYYLLSRADGHLAEMRKKLAARPRVFILAGGRDEGKTGFLKELIMSLQEAGVKAGGFCSPKVMEGNFIRGYDIEEIPGGGKTPFLRKEKVSGAGTIGSYTILPGGLERGLAIIEEATARSDGLIVIDEAGRLEAQGRGWAPAIKKVLETPEKKLLLAVRREFVEEVTASLGIGDYLVYDLNDRATGIKETRFWRVLAEG